MSRPRTRRWFREVGPPVEGEDCVLCGKLTPLRELVNGGCVACRNRAAFEDWKRRQEEKVRK